MARMPTSGTGRGAAHARRRRSTASEEQLRALGEHVPHLSADLLRPIARDRAWRVVRNVIGAVVVVVTVGVQWFRPIPSPVFRAAVPTSVRLAGVSPSLPWPTTGAAALSVEAAGSLGRAGSTQPVPIAGLAKVMTAYVVLRDHPLAPGAAGPSIPVTAATIGAAHEEAATQQSVVPVMAGETLTELEALEGLLVVAGNDIATLLAGWDATSTAAFVAKMNAVAHDVGLDSTRFTDPSGVDPGSVSTPSNMIRLGEAAMAIPAFRQIVAMPQVTLPLAGLVYNPDDDLGHDGIVGIKTGSDSAAGGCFLFEAQQTVAGRMFTLVGVVLGQYGTSPITTALYDAELLTHAAFAAVGTFPLVPPGHLVGRIVTPWSPSVPVTAGSSSMVGWAGLTVPVHVLLGKLPSVISIGAPIGVLVVTLGTQNLDLVLRTSRPLAGPSAIWRLTRL
jgi:serine-type D-Ala-D-Ala carboxypeptidase (penicillin-binding protein 5/6)